MPFPEEIVVAHRANTTIRASVKVCLLPGDLISRLEVDGARVQIFIDKTLDEFMQYVTLLENLLHVSEELIWADFHAVGHMEHYREELAIRLFMMLSESGLWAGLTPEQARSLFEGSAVKSASSARRRKRPRPKCQSGPRRRPPPNASP